MSLSGKYYQVFLKYGVVGGGLTILLFFLLLLMDVNPLVINKRLDFGFIILPIVVFFSIKEFRDLKNNGELRYWQGMTVGFFTFVVVACTSALGLWIILTFIKPELMDGYISDRVNILLSNREMFLESFSEETYKNTLEDIKNVTPAILAVDDFLKKIFAGFFVTVIISVILRR